MHCMRAQADAVPLDQAIGERDEPTGYDRLITLTISDLSLESVCAAQARCIVRRGCHTEQPTDRASNSRRRRLSNLPRLDTASK